MVRQQSNDRKSTLTPVRSVLCFFSDRFGLFQIVFRSFLDRFRIISDRFAQFRMVSDGFGRFAIFFRLFRIVSDCSNGFGLFLDRSRSIRIVFGSFRIVIGPFSDDSTPFKKQQQISIGRGWGLSRADR